MDTNTNGTTWRSARILVAGAIAMATMAGGSAAEPHGDKNVAISGNSVFSDCGSAGSDFALAMTGDLEGCVSIFVQGVTCTELPDFDHYTERGREVFDGTWRGKQGKFDTKYTVDAAYAKGFCDSLDFTLELSGSCTHHIDGRSGAFSNADGVYTMFDVITGVTGDPVTGDFTAGFGANNFLYYGHIRKSGKKGAAVSLDSVLEESRSFAAGLVAAQRARLGGAC
jgi:hypothetical protein